MEMPEQALMLVKDPEVRKLAAEQAPSPPCVPLVEEWRRLVSLGVVPTAPSGSPGAIIRRGYALLMYYHFGGLLRIH